VKTLPELIEEFGSYLTENNFIYVKQTDCLILFRDMVAENHMNSMKNSEGSVEL
jgi:hypothetical protein